MRAILRSILTEYQGFLASNLTELLIKINTGDFTPIEKEAIEVTVKDILDNNSFYFTISLPNKINDLTQQQEQEGTSNE